MVSLASQSTPPIQLVMGAATTTTSPSRAGGEVAMRALAAKVKDCEKGTVVYQLVRSRAEPHTYKLIEIYDEQSSFDQHGASEHFRAGMGQRLPLLSGKPEPDYFDVVD
jgi:quinol monooxygenase YgiN